MTGSAGANRRESERDRPVPPAVRPAAAAAPGAVEQQKGRESEEPKRGRNVQRRCHR